MIDVVNMIFNSMKVKFDILDGNKDIIFINPNKLARVFINLEPLYRKLKPVLKDRIYNNKEYQECLASNILNIAAHYKLYMSKHGLDCKVFLYTANPIKSAGSIHALAYDGYRQDNANSVKNTEYASFNSLWDKTVSMVQIVTNYLQDIYLISAKVIEPSLIPLIIKKNMMLDIDEVVSCADILVTNQDYEMQYTLNGFDIIHTSSKDYPVVCRDNVVDMLYIKNKSRDTKKIYPEYIPLVIALTGDTIRNIKSVKGVGFIKACKAIIKSIECGSGLNIYSTDPFDKVNEIDAISSLVKDKYKETLIKSHEVANIRYLYNTLFRSDIDMIMSQIKDNYELDVNDSITSMFDTYPLEINYLCSRPSKTVKW